MRIIVLLFFLIFSLSSYGHDGHDVETKDGRICAPFRNGVVDPIIVDRMLEAAKEGNLYRIQAKQSRVGFCVNSFVGRLEAEFKGIQGGLALKREVWGDKSQVLVMVDTNSLDMKEEFIEKILKSETFLDTETYSRILFVSSELEWLDNYNARLRGMLTMHGVTRSVTFDVKLYMKEEIETEKEMTLFATASSIINRKDFNLHNLDFLVENTIELCLRIEARLFKNPELSH